MIDLEAFKEKLHEQYRLSGEMLTESELNGNLFHFFYVVDPNLTDLIDKIKIISVGAGKGGTGKSKTASDISYLLAKKGKKTILVDADSHGPNQFRRMQGLPRLVDLDFEKLLSLTGNQAVEYFRKNAPISDNAKEVLIDWYTKGILKELNLPHFLMYRNTIDSTIYKKKLGIEDLPVSAMENLDIVLGLLETSTFPLAINSEEKFKDMVRSVLSLPADKIVVDTSPGVSPLSLYLFNIGDVSYVISHCHDMASLEEPMNFVDGALAYMFQDKAKELPLLQEKIKEIESRYKEGFRKFNEKITELCEKLKINYNWGEYIKNNLLENKSFSINDNAFSLIKTVIEYGKIKYEKNQLEGLNMNKSVINELQEDSQKLSIFEDLTPIGMSLYDFIKKHKDKEFIKKVLSYFNGKTSFILNNVPHGAEKDAKKLLFYVINHFKDYDVLFNQIPGLSYIYSLDEAVMNKATSLAVPSAYYLDGLNNFDSPKTGDYRNQLDKLIILLVK